MLKNTFTILIAVLAFYTSQSQDMYTSRWKKIDSLMQQQGLTESASREVDALLKAARASKNQAQVIKALQYKVTLDLQKQENALEMSVARFEAELKTSAQPGKSVIQSLLAETYWHYLQQNRFRLYQDANAPSTGDSKDLSTWNLNQLNKRIGELYRQSISQASILRKTSVTAFDAIIEKGTARKFRPSLYDLLAFQALAYYRNDEASVSRPADIFRIDDKRYFSPANEFMKLKLKTNDSTSNSYQSIKIYQQLLKLHLADADASAFIDADIDRIVYVREKSTIPADNVLYREALEKIITTWPGQPAADQASFLIANYYAERAARYDPVSDTAYRYDYNKALELVQGIIAAQRKSEGYTNAVNLRNSIVMVSLTHRLEAVNVPLRPFRGLIEYKNATALHYRIVAFNTNDNDLLNRPWEDDFWKQLVARPAISEKTVTLPPGSDHQVHRVEIAIEALPPGEYGILTSGSTTFDVNEKNPLALNRFTVSAISFIQSANDFYVLDRTSGKPLTGATASFSIMSPGNQNNKPSWKNLATYTTDRNGKFSFINNPADYSQKRIEFKHGNDRLTNDYQRRYYSYNSPDTIGIGDEEAKQFEEDQQQAYLFTDRGIYRPGQEMFFKGIFITRELISKRPKLVTGLHSVIYLYDANGQQTDSLSIITNEYGAVNGSFRLPSSLLNGEFRIQDKETGSSISIRVEEYKRPKFMVELKPPAGSYRVNDSISVKGVARAFAGNSITGAKLNYKVIRRTIVPFYTRAIVGKIWPPLRQEETVIATGTITTNGSGEFTIPFVALPDPEVEPSFYPTFNYEVQADVVDINSESHSGLINVYAGYQSIQINLDVPLVVSTDSLRRINLSTTNFNGVFEKARVTISFTKLNAPAAVYRQRYWQQPDQFIYSEKEFHQLFPTDQYKAESVVAQWPKTSEVILKVDTSRASGMISIDKPIPPGHYELQVIALSAAGDTVRRTEYIQVTGTEPQTGAAYVQLQGKRRFLQLNEPFSYKLSTNLPDVYLIRQLAINDAIQPSTGQVINKTLEDQGTRIKEYGQARLDIAFVKDNRFYTQTISVDIVDERKKLDIHLSSYRNKVLPGSKETWKVKVSGAKGEKAAADILTGMYDASLDQFVSHQWQIPSVWLMPLANAEFFAGENFQMADIQQKYIQPEPTEAYAKLYDMLSVTHPTNIQVRIRGVASAAPAAQDAALNEVVVVGYGMKKTASMIKKDSIATPVNQPLAAQFRKDFRETAFFFPSLSTDTEGNTELNFTMPEAMTTWKWMTLAYNKDLAFGYKEESIISQKEFMVQPNLPRFLREGDRIDLSTKIVNLGSKELTGQVELQLIDPETNQSVDGWFRNVFPNQYFTVAAGESVVASFSLEVPYQYAKPVIYRFVASADSLSDGEEGILPVLLSKVMVTETVTLPVLNQQKKQVKLDKLLNSGSSETLSTQSLTVEFTSNPAWLAVQALPSLTDNKDGSSEQIFYQLYAGALARKIVEETPAIAKLYTNAQISDTSLHSKLERNETLKSVLLQQTPWVLEARNETENMERIGSLFKFWSVQQHLMDAVTVLESLQRADGSFSWMNGGPSDRFVTQNILTGIGRLIHMKALNNELHKRLMVIVSRGMRYADDQLQKEYAMQKKSTSKLTSIGALQVQYLYMRSLFPSLAVPGTSFEAYNTYRKLSTSSWVKLSRQLQGMTALALFRTGDKMNALRIVRSLKENALHSKEMGMYWNESIGYNWYQSGISTQTMMIETFNEVISDSALVDEMKVWLIKNKQTNSWPGDKSTADACYALLLSGSNWLSSRPDVEIHVGSLKFNASKVSDQGSGYFITSIEGQKVKPEMGDIQVFVKTPATSQPMFGAVYWKYTEDVEKITESNSPVKITRRLFLQKNTSKGTVLEPIVENATLHPGDKITVRIDIRADRSMEYVHVSDMRASGLEPLATLSGYSWKSWGSVYQVTRDASTDFYVDRLPKGNFHMEYELVVNNTGSFTNGISTVQCLYAPEFTGHTAGIRFHADPE